MHSPWSAANAEGSGDCEPVDVYLLHWDNVNKMSRYEDGLQFVKQFGGASHAAEVALFRSKSTPKPASCDGNLQQCSIGDLVVKKRYDLKDRRAASSFHREFAILKRLTDLGCECSPKLLHWNVERGELFMSYCGGPAKNTRGNRKALEAARTHLAAQFGVHFAPRRPRWRKFLEWLREGGMYLHNATVSAGPPSRLVVIDFGAEAWKLLPIPAHHR